MAAQSRNAKRKKGKRSGPPVVLSRKKKIAFAFSAAVLSCASILLAEGCLRLVRYGGDPRLFVAAPVEGGRFLTCNREIGRQYFPYLAKAPKPSWDAFLKDKPSNGIRLFVLGGSTAAGFPYGNNLMFSRILNVRLQEAFPDRKIEIVNTAMSATNTYTQLDFLDEILAQKPDAILVYSGHNEFYGALGVASRESLGQSPVVARAYLKLRRLKLFVLAQDAVGLVRGVRKQNADYDPSATLMERMVGAKAIPLDSRLYRQGTRQFAENLDRVYQKAHAAGVPIVISELVSNVRDQRPFVSVATGLAPAADLVFRDAQALEREGDHEQANRLYTKAKDLDALRFRASEEFNEIIHETARRYGGAVVPMKSRFEAASPEGIIGDHLMVDHLHPNVDGCFLMAEAFFDTIRDAKVIDLPWDSTAVKPIEHYRQNWGMTDLDMACAELSIRYLKGGWPFQPQAGPNRSLQSFQPQGEVQTLALRVLTDDAYSIILAHDDLAQRHERKGRYLEAHHEYRALYHTVPWSTIFLNDAAKNLLRLKRTDEVPALLVRSLEIQETFFALRWMGHLLVNQSKFAEAIPYLERAREGHEDNEQVLLCLEQAYRYTGREDEAAAIGRKLKTPARTSRP